MSHPSEQQTFTVQVTSRLSGLSAHVLRAWEKRYQAVQPIRTKSGRRTYLQEHLVRLGLLKFLVERGHSIGSIAHISDAGLQHLVTDIELLPPAKTLDDPTWVHASLNPNLCLEQVIEALRRFDLPLIHSFLTAAKQNLDPRAFCISLIRPILGEVGTQISAGTMDISQERAISSLIRDQLGQIVQRAKQSAPKKNTRMVFATAQGEYHEFGIFLAQVLAACAGIPCFYLGSNLPAEQFAKACSKLKAQIAVLGTSEPHPEATQDHLNGYLTQLDQDLPQEQQLWIGGKGQFELEIFSSQRSVRRIGTLESFEALVSQLP